MGKRREQASKDSGSTVVPPMETEAGRSRVGTRSSAASAAAEAVTADPPLSPKGGITSDGKNTDVLTPPSDTVKSTANKLRRSRRISDTIGDRSIDSQPQHDQHKSTVVSDKNVQRSDAVGLDQKDQQKLASDQKDKKSTSEVKDQQKPETEQKCHQKPSLEKKSQQKPASEQASEQKTQQKPACDINHRQKLGSDKKGEQSRVVSSEQKDPQKASVVSVDSQSSGDLGQSNKQNSSESRNEKSKSKSSDVSRKKEKETYKRPFTETRDSDLKKSDRRLSFAEQLMKGDQLASTTKTAQEKDRLKSAGERLDGMDRLHVAGSSSVKDGQRSDELDKKEKSNNLSHFKERSSSADGKGSREASSSRSDKIRSSETSCCITPHRQDRLKSSSEKHHKDDPREKAAESPSKRDSKKASSSNNKDRPKASTSNSDVRDGRKVRDSTSESHRQSVSSCTEERRRELLSDSRKEDRWERSKDESYKKDTLKASGDTLCKESRKESRESSGHGYQDKGHRKPFSSNSHERDQSRGSSDSFHKKERRDASSDSSLRKNEREKSSKRSDEKDRSKDLNKRSREKDRQENSSDMSSSKDRRKESFDRDRRKESSEMDRQKGSSDKDRRKESMDKDRRKESSDKDRRKESVERDRRKESISDRRKESSEMDRRKESVDRYRRKESEDTNRRKESSDKDRRKESSSSQKKDQQQSSYRSRESSHSNEKTIKKDSDGNIHKPGNHEESRDKSFDRDRSRKSNDVPRDKVKRDESKRSLEKRDRDGSGDGRSRMYQGHSSDTSHTKDRRETSKESSDRKSQRGTDLDRSHKSGSHVSAKDKKEKRPSVVIAPHKGEQIILKGNASEKIFGKADAVSTNETEKVLAAVCPNKEATKEEIGQDSANLRVRRSARRDISKTEQSGHQESEKMTRLITEKQADGVPARSEERSPFSSKRSRSLRGESSATTASHRNVKLGDATSASTSGRSTRQSLPVASTRFTRRASKRQSGLTVDAEEDSCDADGLFEGFDAGCLQSDVSLAMRSFLHRVEAWVSPPEEEKKLEKWKVAVKNTNQKKEEEVARVRSIPRRTKRACREREKKAEILSRKDEGSSGDGKKSVLGLKTVTVLCKKLEGSGDCIQKDTRSLTRSTRGDKLLVKTTGQTEETSSPKQPVKRFAGDDPVPARLPNANNVSEKHERRLTRSRAEVVQSTLSGTSTCQATVSAARETRSSPRKQLNPPKTPVSSAETEKLKMGTDGLKTTLVNSPERTASSSRSPPQSTAGSRSPGSSVSLLLAVPPPDPDDNACSFPSMPSRPSESEDSDDAPLVSLASPEKKREEGRKRSLLKLRRGNRKLVKDTERRISFDFDADKSTMASPSLASLAVHQAGDSLYVPPPLALPVAGPSSAETPSSDEESEFQGWTLESLGLRRDATPPFDRKDEMNEEIMDADTNKADNTNDTVPSAASLTGSESDVEVPSDHSELLGASDPEDNNENSLLATKIDEAVCTGDAVSKAPDELEISGPSSPLGQDDHTIHSENEVTEHKYVLSNVDDLTEDRCRDESPTATDTEGKLESSMATEEKQNTDSDVRSVTLDVDHEIQSDEEDQDISDLGRPEGGQIEADCESPVKEITSEECKYDDSSHDVASGEPDINPRSHDERLICGGADQTSRSPSPNKSVEDIDMSILLTVEPTAGTQLNAEESGEKEGALDYTKALESPSRGDGSNEERDLQSVQTTRNTSIDEPLFNEASAGPKSDTVSKSLETGTDASDCDTGLGVPVQECVPGNTLSEKEHHEEEPGTVVTEDHEEEPATVASDPEAESKSNWEQPSEALSREELSSDHDSAAQAVTVLGNEAHLKGQMGEQREAEPDSELCLESLSDEQAPVETSSESNSKQPIEKYGPNSTFESGSASHQEVESSHDSNSAEGLKKSPTDSDSESNSRLFIEEPTKDELISRSLSQRAEQELSMIESTVSSSRKEEQICTETETKTQNQACEQTMTYAGLGSTIRIPDQSSEGSALSEISHAEHGGSSSDSTDSMPKLVISDADRNSACCMPEQGEEVPSGDIQAETASEKLECKSSLEEQTAGDAESPTLKQEPSAVAPDSDVSKPGTVSVDVDQGSSEQTRTHIPDAKNEASEDDNVEFKEHGQREKPFKPIANETLAASTHSRNLKQRLNESKISSAKMEEKLRSYKPITENLWLLPKQKVTKQQKQTRRMVCDCSLTADEAERGDKGCGTDCLNRLLMIECGARCPVGERCSNRRFTRREYSRTEVFKTELKGYGLRAVEDLPAGAFVYEYVGEVLDERQFRRRRRQYGRLRHKHQYFMSLGGDTVVDATEKGNASRFINHSCEPNAETQKWTVNGEIRIGFFTLKPVKKGEEITFDYKLRRYGRRAQQCFCGSAHCRGWIGRKDEENEEKSGSSESESEEEDERQENEEKSPVLSRTERLKQLRRDAAQRELSQEIGRLVSSGLKNRHQTLELCRLMVRAESDADRCTLLHVLRTADQPCRRLFLDYHGLRLIWTWMASGPTSQHSADPDTRTLRKQILQTLSDLPLTDRTALRDSRVLGTVERWAEAPGAGTPPSPDTDPPSDHTPPESAADTTSSSSSQTEPAEITALAKQLLDTWSGLQEVAFRIPKKERVQRMKQHEKEADRGYQTYLQQQTVASSQYAKRGYDCSPERRKRSRESPEPTDRRVKKYKVFTDSRLSKEERRKLFTLEVQQQEEQERRQKEEERRQKEEERRQKEQERLRLQEQAESASQQQQQQQQQEQQQQQQEQQQQQQQPIQQQQHQQQQQPSQQENQQQMEQQELWVAHEQRCTMLGLDPYLTPIFDASFQYYWEPSSGAWQPYTPGDPAVPLVPVAGADPALMAALPHHLTVFQSMAAVDLTQAQQYLEKVARQRPAVPQAPSPAARSSLLDLPLPPEPSQSTPSSTPRSGQHDPPLPPEPSPAQQRRPSLQERISSLQESPSVPERSLSSPESRPRPPRPAPLRRQSSQPAPLPPSVSQQLPNIGLMDLLRAQVTGKFSADQTGTTELPSQASGVSSIPLPEETPQPATPEPAPPTSLESGLEPPLPAPAEIPLPTALEPPLPASADIPLPAAPEPPLPGSAEPPLPAALEPPLPASAEPPLPSSVEPPLPVPAPLVPQDRSRPPPPPEPEPEPAVRLPANWRSATDESTGRVYYYHRLTSETRWEPPDHPDSTVADPPAPRRVSSSADSDSDSSSSSSSTSSSSPSSSDGGGGRRRRRRYSSGATSTSSSTQEGWRAWKDSLNQPSPPLPEAPPPPRLTLDEDELEEGEIREELIRRRGLLPTPPASEMVAADPTGERPPSPAPELSREEQRRQRRRQRQQARRDRRRDRECERLLRRYRRRQQESGRGAQTSPSDELRHVREQAISRFKEKEEALRRHQEQAARERRLAEAASEASAAKRLKLDPARPGSSASGQGSGSGSRSGPAQPAAAAAASSEAAKKMKDKFLVHMSAVVVNVLNNFRKPSCKQGRITSTEDFKHLAKKLTHHVLVKELRSVKRAEELVPSEAVKHKARYFVRKYMSRYGEVYGQNILPEPPAGDM